MSAGERPWSGRRLHFVGVGGAGHERLRARRARARRRGQRLGRAPSSPYLRAPARRRRAATRAIGHDAANVPGGRRRRARLLLGRAGGERRARGRARARAARAPARRAARRADARCGARSRSRARTARRRPSSMLVARAARGRAASRAGWSAAPIGGGLANARLGRGRVARRRGRRVRPLDAQPRRRDRGADERRARPPRDVRLAGGAARGLPRVPGAARRQAVVWDRPELLELRDGPARRLRRRRRSSSTEGGSRFRLARAARCALAVPGAHNALERRRRRWRRRAWRAPTPARAIGGAGGLPRRRAALSAARRDAARARVVVRRLRPPPDRGRGDARGARARSRTTRLVAVFQPHLYSRTRAARARVRRARSPAPTWSSCSTSTRRASARRSIPGVSGLHDRRGGRRRRAAAGRSTGCRASTTPSRVLAALLGEGDLCVVMGAGDVDALGARLVAPMARRAATRASAPRAPPPRASSATSRSRA